MRMLLTGDWAPETNQVNLGIDETTCLGNLEAPIVPGGTSLPPAVKAGPLLASRVLPQSKGKWIVSGANNHLMDYGVAGFHATRHATEAAGICLVGVGDNLVGARQPIYLELKGCRIAIIACCETQFGAATENSAGVAGIGPWIYGAICSAKAKVDHVIVSCHAGLEDFPLPAGWQRDLYRSWIDAGASVIHGHHSHVPQCYEQYNDGLIAYGLGNFAVNPSKWSASPNALWSLAFDLQFHGKGLTWRALTFEIRSEPGGIRIEESSPGEQVIRKRYLAACCSILADNKRFLAAQHHLALLAYELYGSSYMGFINSRSMGENSLAYPVIQAVRCVRSCFSGQKQERSSDRLRYLMIACESHRQMLTTALGIRTGELEDCRMAEVSDSINELMLSDK